MVNAPLQVAVDGGAISRFALLDRIETIDAMPKTSVGKIDKKALRARFAAPTKAVAEAVA